MKLLGLIPARKGSKRMPGKNMVLLNGVPLLEYTILSALSSCLFDHIVVSTDWGKVAGFSRTYNNLHNLDVLMRPDELCTDIAHDYQWVKHAVDKYPGFDAFAILRPTSPFRTAETIRRAFDVFKTGCDSVRAVEPTGHHPGKSWVLDGGRMDPYVFDCGFGFIRDYDMPTQALERVYCQNACIHIAKTEVLEKYKNVTGDIIKPFLTTGDEGIDINTPDDLAYAEWVMRGRL